MPIDRVDCMNCVHWRESADHSSAGECRRNLRLIISEYGVVERYLRTQKYDRCELWAASGDEVEFTERIIACPQCGEQLRLTLKKEAHGH